MGAVSSVVDKVGSAVNNVVKTVENNPVAAVLDVAAVASGNPELVPAINGVNAVANGASPQDVAKTIATSYVAGQAAQAITPDIGSSVAADTGSQVAGNTAQAGLNSLVSGTLQGKDPVTSGTAGVLGSLSNQGIDATGNTIQDANSAQVSPAPAPITVPTAGNLPDVQLPPTDYGYNYDAVTNQVTPVSTPEEIMAANAGANPTAYTYNPNTGALVPAYTTNEICAANSATLGCYNDPTAITNSGLAQLAKSVITPAVVGSIMNPSDTGATGSRQNALKYGFNLEDSGVPWLDTKTQMLKGLDLPQDKVGVAGGLGGAEVPQFHVPTANTNITGMTPEMLDVLHERGINLASGGAVQNFACGSSASSYCSTWGPMGAYAPKFYAVKCNVLTPAGIGKRNPITLAPLAQIRPTLSAQGGMIGAAKGGLPSKYEEAAPDGHHPEFITGLTGYYAGGRGTGQSDDIPAMLHDGDYVIDAEAVSAFGDGSSKAGNEVLMKFMHEIPHSKTEGGKPVPAKIADGEVVLPESFVTALGGGDNKRGAKMLDAMRQRLREHKRSAPNSKIPPKAKSPLEYLEGVKG